MSLQDLPKSNESGLFTACPKPLEDQKLHNKPKPKPQTDNYFTSKPIPTFKIPTKPKATQPPSSGLLFSNNEPVPDNLDQ
jgi:hypothetical protein